jgi:hypothetical protein
MSSSPSIVVSIEADGITVPPVIPYQVIFKRLPVLVPDVIVLQRCFQSIVRMVLVSSVMDYLIPGQG